MGNSIKKVTVALTASICSKMALSASASACSWNLYQPEEPKCLKNRA